MKNKNYDIKGISLLPSFPQFIIKEDNDRYERFIRGKKTVDEYEEDMMQVISILERLGFSLDEAGTYLYKELIIYIYSRIKKEDEENQIIRELYDKNSKSYNGVAVDYLKMNLSQYHVLVKESIDNIDKTKVDKELEEKIFEDDYNINYGLNAYKIASYYSATKLKEKTKKSGRGLKLLRIFNKK